MTLHHTLSAADRRKLVEAPFPVTRVIPGKSWGGVNLGETNPGLDHDGCRQSGRTRIGRSDESWIRYGRSEDDAA